jgi:hypothetical protein
MGNLSTAADPTHHASNGQDGMPGTNGTGATHPPEQRRQSAAEVAAWLRLLAEPGQVLELRALRWRDGYRRPCTIAGFYDDLDAMARKAVDLTPRSEGVYFTLNPVDPALKARCANRTQEAEQGFSAADKDITRRRRLLLDADPVRPKGISATDAEKARALEAARAVAEYLRGLGWPHPILADSGNGYHLLYRIDLPAEDGGLVKRVLAALAARFNTPAVKIDTSVFNPARITKLYGTLARKGDSIPERPHRRSAILELPDGGKLDTVPVELLEQLAAEAPAEEAPHASSAAAGNGRYTSRLLVERWLGDRGQDFRRKPEPDAKGRTVYVLKACPFNPDHADPDSCVMQATDGKLYAKCLHDSCRGKGWQDFKQAIGPPGPEHHDPPLKAKKRGSASPAPSAPGAGEDDQDDLPTMHQLILAYLRERYQPVYREASAIYSGRLGELVRPSEACNAPTYPLLQQLAFASDAPRSEYGVRLAEIARLFRTWAAVAWQDLLAELPIEPDAAEVSPRAAEHFGRRLTAALVTIVAFGHRYDGKDGGERTDTQRRALVEWAEMWAKKPGVWNDLRSYRMWSKKGAAGRLEIALRVELFDQVGMRDLARLTQRQFDDLVELYGYGQGGRAGGKRAAILNPDYVAWVRSGPSPENSWANGRTQGVAGASACGQAGAHARGTCVNSSTEAQAHAFPTDAVDESVDAEPVRQRGRAPAGVSVCADDDADVDADSQKEGAAPTAGREREPGEEG